MLRPSCRFTLRVSVRLIFKTLEIILKRETLNTREAVVFQAALDWAVAECKRQGLGPTSRNKGKCWARLSTWFASQP